MLLSRAAAADARSRVARSSGYERPLIGSRLTSGASSGFRANVRDLTLVKISELCLIIVVLDSAASHSNTKRMRVAVLAVAGLISCAAAFALAPASRSNSSSKLAV